MPYQFRLPDIGEGIVEGEVVRWLVRIGDEIEEDQPMVEVMTDKATVEIPSPVKGRVVEQGGNEGDVVQVGSVLVVIETGKEEAESQPVHTKSHTPTRRPPIRRRRKTARILATPAIRRLAKQMKIDLEGVKGTGPGGRITREDLTRAQAPAPVSPAVPTAAGPTERIPYRGIRRRIGDHMLQASNHAPHFTYVEEVDVTELVRMRQRAQGSEEFQGVRLTFLPYILKALAHELKRHPDLNARLDLDAGEIELRKYYNIGVATQTEEGLMVPVIRNVDRKSLPELAREISRISQLAREGNLKLEHLQGSTFTVTSLGALGGIVATPIVNYPEVAILGVHKIAPRPVVRSGRIVIREIMHLSLSQDHRVVDGAVGARFLQDVIARLESPETGL
ncbi:MAG: dihydrolipoamide acetyltransferase family protein [Acidobacteriota bacterium]|nr:dihydrolipoamide acetyltransferase family protein [Acidobacteriota bacterium]